MTSQSAVQFKLEQGFGLDARSSMARADSRADSLRGTSAFDAGRLMSVIENLTLWGGCEFRRKPLPHMGNRLVISRRFLERRSMDSGIVDYLWGLVPGVPPQPGSDEVCCRMSVASAGNAADSGLEAPGCTATANGCGPRNSRAGLFFGESVKPSNIDKSAETDCRSKECHRANLPSQTDSDK